MSQTNEVLNTYFATRSYKKTADLLGLSYDAVRKRVKRNLPPGATTHIKQGEIVQQWLRSPKSGVQCEDVVDGLRDALKGFKPPAPLKTALKGSSSLLGLLPLADLHMGMRAWAKETGAIDWDTNIATKKYQAGIDKLSQQMPKVKKGIVLVAGDLTHADNYHQGTTNPNTHHIVDVDGRYPKIVAASGDIVIYAVERALEWAETVECVILPGNHDAATSAGLSYALEIYYKKNKRVSVRGSTNPHWSYQWGDTMLAGSHGDTLPMRRFGAYMADQYAEMWGKTKWRFGFIGHLHQKVVESHPGVEIQILPTPCAPDSFASKHGYGAMRMFQAMVYCKNEGLKHTYTELL